MGIQINGITDTISASDGGLSVSGAELLTVSNLNISGVSTISQLLIGSGTLRTNLGTNSERTIAQIEGVGITSSLTRGRLSIINNSASAGSAAQIFLCKSYANSIGSNSIVLENDGIGNLSYLGNDGVNFIQSAFIVCQIDGNPGINSMPGRLTFATTPHGAATATGRMAINSHGNVLIGSATSTGTVSQNLQVTGGAYVSDNLGVGVTNPIRKLDIATSTNDDGMLITNSSANGSRIRLNSTGTGGRQYHIVNTADGSGFGGGKLVITDNTASDAARFVIDSSGRLLVGTSSARANFGNSTESAAFQIEGTDANRRLSITGVDNAAVAILARQRSGTVGGNTILNSGDLIGVTRFEGSDGSEFVIAAQISAEVDGTPGTNDMPGRLVFSTTADGASSPTERCRISNSGGFSVGTTANPGAGAIFATGDITAFYSSDIRLKKDIEPISEPIKKLMEISGVTYKWNEEYLKDKEVDGYFVRETEVGVIAQEVEKVLPEVVATRENGYKAVRYEKLVALLIEAVKDQQHQIDELKVRLEEK